MRISGRQLRVRGVVQGVGFRPFVYRLATGLGVRGTVQNGPSGVEIRAFADEATLDELTRCLRDEAPPAARIVSIESAPLKAPAPTAFTIVPSDSAEHPTVRIAPDLPVCAACLREMRDPTDRRYQYPFINCTNCGPRYSIIERLPYDRPHTTMAVWPMCAACQGEYDDPADRRYHAQPVACPACGPTYVLEVGGEEKARGSAAVAATVELLRDGGIVALKGIGGFHLACDARHPTAVAVLRERKVRKEKPFAVMVRDRETASELVELSAAAARLLADPARPIVLCPARAALPQVAPGNDELGLMLPYTPLHCLLFDRGAPAALVMTSANVSDEPLCYRDQDAREQLGEIADAFLIGERRIARRVDDSVTRAGPTGPMILRRARGYAPAAVAELPTDRPILAVGGDLKNTVTLVVDGQAFVSQHVGDLAHAGARDAFVATVHDLLEMYAVRREELRVVCDAHPDYASTRYARATFGDVYAVQHHRAHIASVLAEHQAWDTTVVGVALDGTGFGDDGTIWGGEVFVGDMQHGFRRAVHLRSATLPGGDAAARHPVQAAAGFLAALGAAPDLTQPPFGFPARYSQAAALVERGVRCFPTTSCGRLFDTVAALMGFTRAISFEGQAAIWLEQQARAAAERTHHSFDGLDYAPALEALIADRLAGRDARACAYGFHSGLAEAFSHAAISLAEENGAQAVALSGGVFQNRLLLELMVSPLRSAGLTVWANTHVPPNDGGLSLGQAAMAAFLHPD